MTNEAESTGKNMGLQDKLSREKYWRELGLEEKVERLRGVVNGLNTDNRHLRARIQELEDKFYKHSHGASQDTPMVPAHQDRPPGYGYSEPKRIRSDEDVFI